MKISANAIKKELENKLLEQKKISAKVAQEQAKRKKLINDVLSRCLSSAMEGYHYVDLGFDFENLESIEALLEDKWIEIKYIDAEDYLAEQIEEMLERGTPEQNRIITRVIEARSRAIKLSLNELRFCPDNSELYDSVVELIDLVLSDVEKNLSKAIVHMFKANEFSKELDFDLDEIEDEKIKSNLKIAKSEIKDDFREIAVIFKEFNLKKLPDEEEYAKYLKWEKMTDEDVKYHITDDYTDATSLAYLASFHGQLFINAFKNAVEQEMAKGSKSLQLTLFKYSSGHLLEFKNKAQIHTVYDEVALDQLFRKLGYSVDKQLSGEDEADFIIAWKN